MKRSLLILCALALIVAPSVKAQVKGDSWTCSVDDAADVYVLCASASESRRYITGIVAQSTNAFAGMFQLGYGTAGANPCAAGFTSIVFPGLTDADTGRFAAAANTSRATVISLTVPVSVPPGKDFCILGDATNSVTLQVTGYLAP